METQLVMLNVMTDLRQQPKAPEEDITEHLSPLKISQLQKQRSFKRRATQNKSASWKGK